MINRIVEDLCEVLLQTMNAYITKKQDYNLGSLPFLELTQESLQNIEF